MDHGGLEQLKSTFSAAAMGMFTSGWIWFVSDKSGSTTILPTLGPGTLLVRSRTYMAEKTPNLYHEMTPDPFEWDRDLKYVGKYLADWGIDGQGTVPPLFNEESLSDALSTDPPTRGSIAPLQRRFLHTSATTRQADEWNNAPNSIYSKNENSPQTTKTLTDTLHAGEVLFPLFCISVQEHAWLTAGYGVWGKEAWLREFWSVLNWRQVSEGYKQIRYHSGLKQN